MLYPKICPPIFFKVLTSIISICSRVAQFKHPPKPVKLGFWFLQGSWGFQGLNQVPYAHTHCQAPTCQVSRLTRSSCTVKNPNCSTVNCRGKMVIWQSKVKIFGQHIILKPKSSFGQILTMISQEWLKNHQGVKRFYFWTAEKSTVTWPRHNVFMVHQKNPIQFSFLRGWHFLQLIFTFQVQEMLSQKVINLYHRSISKVNKKAL